MPKVLVNKTTKYNEKNGTTKLVSAKPKIYEVVEMYSPTKVKTSSGDVWNVKPYNKKQKQGKHNVHIDYIIADERSEAA